MTFGNLNTRDEVKRQRAKQPHRTGGTVKARPETLREVFAHSGGAGVGLLVPSQQSVYPFEDEAEYKKYAAAYDTLALERISRSLREPGVRDKMTHDDGTAPELHVLGKYLHLGWRLGGQIEFQDATLFGFRKRHKIFVTDIALKPGGRFVLCPVDGEEFHSKLQVEREDATRRDQALRKQGQVCTIPSRFCFEGTTLDAFMAQHLGVGLA